MATFKNNQILAILDRKMNIFCGKNRYSRGRICSQTPCPRMQSKCPAESADPHLLRQFVMDNFFLLCYDLCLQKNFGHN